MNPTFLREIRQAVRNRLLMVLVWGLPVVLAALFFIRLMQGLQRFPVNDGQELFIAVIAIVGIGTAVFSVLHTLLRCVVDRVNEDPMFTTTLTPGRIVRGRMLTTLVFSGVAYTIAIPFIVLAYQFRGVDIGMVILCLLVAFWWTQVLNAITVAFFIGVNGWIEALARTVPFLAAMWGFGLLGGLNVMILIPYFAPPRNAWAVIGFGPVLCGVALPLIAYWLACAQLVPATAERMFPVRRGVAILIPVLLLSGLAYVKVVTAYGAPRMFYEGAAILSLMTGVVLLCLFALIIVCERNDYPLRQRQSIPEHSWLRVLRFPFASGVVNGFCWLPLVGFVWILGTCLFLPASTSGDSDFELLPWFRGMLTFLFFLIDYTVTARLLWEFCLKRFVPRRNVWMLAVALIVIVTVGSIALHTWLDARTPREFSRFGVLRTEAPRTCLLLCPTPWMPNDWIPGMYDPLQTVAAAIWFWGICGLGLMALIERLPRFQRPTEPVA